MWLFPCLQEEVHKPFSFLCLYSPNVNRQFLLNRLMTTRLVWNLLGAKQGTELQCCCQRQERQMPEGYFSCFKANDQLQGLLILQKSNLPNSWLQTQQTQQKETCPGTLPICLNESPSFSEALWYNTSTVIMDQAPAIFHPSEIIRLPSDKNWKSDTYRCGRKSFPSPTWKVCPGFYFRSKTGCMDGCYFIYIPYAVFIVFIAARIVDSQWINITACKAGVKYDFIYKNLSEIKDTASSPVRLPVGNSVDKVHKKQLAILHLKRNAASKWAKQV